MPEFLVLDSFALLAFYQKESGSIVVEEALKSASKGKITIFVSEITIGEVYYMAFKKQGKEKAELALANLWTLPVKFMPCGREEILAAASLKAQNSKISYADCFVIALALSQNAAIITGDPEFKVFEKKIPIVWLEIGCVQNLLLNS
jgi:ribonuclease VapC